MNAVIGREVGVTKAKTWKKLHELQDKLPNYPIKRTKRYLQMLTNQETCDGWHCSEEATQLPTSFFLNALIKLSSKDSLVQRPLRFSPFVLRWKNTAREWRSLMPSVSFSIAASRSRGSMCLEHCVAGERVGKKHGTSSLRWCSKKHLIKSMVIASKYRHDLRDEVCSLPWKSLFGSHISSYVLMASLQCFLCQVFRPVNKDYYTVYKNPWKSAIGLALLWCIAISAVAASVHGTSPIPDSRQRRPGRTRRSVGACPKQRGRKVMQRSRSWISHLPDFFHASHGGKKQIQGNQLEVDTFLGMVNDSWRWFKLQSSLSSKFAIESVRSPSKSNWESTTILSKLYFVRMIRILLVSLATYSSLLVKSHHLFRKKSWPTQLTVRMIPPISVDKYQLNLVIAPPKKKPKRVPPECWVTVRDVGWCTGGFLK